MMLMARTATPAQKVRRHVALSAGVTALGGLLFGYDTGVVSGALLFVKKDFGGLSSFQEELITSLLLVGAVVGALLAGRVADLIGRRLTVLITAAIFVVGVLLAAFTPTYPVLLVARVVIGLAVGSASMVVPLYIGEVVPPRFRGGLVSLNQLAITAGILVSYLIDYGLSGSANWRLMFGLAAIPAVLLFVGMLLAEREPALADPAGPDRRGQGRAQAGAERRRHRRRDPRRPGGQPQAGGRPRAAVALGPAAGLRGRPAGRVPADHRHQHGHLLRSDAAAGAGFGSSAALLANVVNGVVNVGMTIVAIWLLDRAGRRPLLLSGTAGMAVGMVITACAFLGGENLHGALAIVAVIGLLIYTGSFAIGLGPVFWLLIAEIYPLRIRGAAMSVATMANWGANFVVTVSFLTLLNAISGVGVFFLFGFLTLVALGYFWRKVPETKGRSLQEIEHELTGSKA